MLNPIKARAKTATAEGDDEKDLMQSQVAGVSRIRRETFARVMGQTGGKVETGRLDSHMRSLPSTCAFHV